MSNPATQPVVAQSPQEPKKKRGFLKWIPLGIVLVLASCGIIVGAVGGEDRSASRSPAATSAEAEPTSVAEEPEPEPEVDPAYLLKADIEDALGDSNRDVRRVKVTTSGKAGKPVTVKVAFDDNLTDNLRRIGARKDVVDILKAVQIDTDWKYSDVVVRGTFSMVDAYGDVEESQVVFARYSRKTVDRIDFDNFLSDNIWKVADARLIHPEFR